jgi:hypothetical protein
MWRILVFGCPQQEPGFDINPLRNLLVLIQSFNRLPAKETDAKRGGVIHYCPDYLCHDYGGKRLVEENSSIDGRSGESVPDLSRGRIFSYSCGRLIDQYSS